VYRVRNLPNLSGIRRLGVWRRFFLKISGPFSFFEETRNRQLRDIRDVTEYAKSTGIRPSQVWDRLNRKKKCPLSMCGVPIEDRKGRLWGVFIFDSSNQYESVDTNDSKFKVKLRSLVKLLHKLEITD